MPKQIFIAAFLVDPAEYNSTLDSSPITPVDIVHHLSSTLSEEGLSDFIVWPSAEDFVADHTERGPINVGYLEGADACDNDGPLPSCKEEPDYQALEEERHRRMVEAQEIADGAYGDGPLTRGAAKRYLGGKTAEADEPELIIPTMNKVDMMNCACGHHDFSDEAPICRVCGASEEAASAPASPAIIKGSGFRLGGFETIHINGRDYDPDDVARAIACYQGMLNALNAFVGACGGSPPDWLRAEYALAESEITKAEGR